MSDTPSYSDFNPERALDEWAAEQRRVAREREDPLAAVLDALDRSPE